MADGPARDFLMVNGDLGVVNGDFAVVAGADAVPQGIQIRVSTFLSEIYLDEEQGVDYLGKIFVKNPDPLEVRAELSEAILDTPDVTDAVGAGLQGPDANRRATIGYQAATVYSTDPIAGQVQVP